MRRNKIKGWEKTQTMSKQQYSINVEYRKVGEKDIKKVHETEWRKIVKCVKCDMNKKKKNPDYVFLGHFWPKLMKWKAKSRLVFIENSLSVEVTFLFLLLLPGVSRRTWQVNAASGPSKWADAFAALSVLHSRGNALHEAVSLQKLAFTVTQLSSSQK